MKQLWLGTKEKAVSFFSNYAKVSTASFLVVLSVALVVGIGMRSVSSSLQVSFFDVGQGDAIFIQTPDGHDVLIDGGPNSSVLGDLSSRMSYLDREIDVIIATHGDADHITGLIPVLERYDVAHIVTSPVAADTSLFDDFAKRVMSEGAHVHVARKGDVIDLGGGAEIHVLYPHAYVPKKVSTNDASVSVVLVYGEHSFLLTGDLTSVYEHQLTHPVLSQHITVYKAGHHGSKSSSGEALLKRIKPEYVVVSVGKDNRYGHPAPEVITRLQKHSQEILSTIDRGTITFVSDGRVLDVKTER